MSEAVRTIPQPDVATAPAQAPAEQAASTPERDAQLKELFGVDYDYAHDSGIIDMFDYRPAEGVDGLMHTFAGDVETGGFHHEPSGKVLGNVTLPNGEEVPAREVDRSHLEGANSAHSRWYKERPAEPFLAKIALDGRPKMQLTKAPNGEQHLMHTRNAMFPNEYDALGVAQAVRQAVNTQDESKARASVDSYGEPVVVTQGEAVLIDGVSKMPIRLILNADTKRVKAAFPMISGKKGIMDLEPEQMWAHATGSPASQQNLHK
ncbi:MAG TPA: hypothetical protein VLF62_01160 [Candidatus Saccharimonadales bacterium]|jgi:hypothetical protein|nr:hypothetical protein [Candidatus Saccharimonadales bacterium]